MKTKAKVKFKNHGPVVIKKGQDAAEAIGKRMGAFIMTTARRSLPRQRKTRSRQSRQTTESIIHV